MNNTSPLQALLETLFALESGWILLKFGYVLMFGLYLIFALVVVVQIRQMTATVHGRLDRLITLVGYGHLVVAGAALLVAVVLL